MCIATLIICYCNIATIANNASPDGINGLGNFASLAPAFFLRGFSFNCGDGTGDQETRPAYSGGAIRCWGQLEGTTSKWGTTGSQRSSQKMDGRVDDCLLYPPMKRGVERQDCWCYFESGPEEDKEYRN